MTGMDLLKLAFLDTNALVALFSYWEACRIAQVSLTSVSSWKSLQQSLALATAPVTSVLKSDDFQPIKMGHQCFQTLDASKADLAFCAVK